MKSNLPRRILHILGTPNWAGAKNSVLSLISHPGLGEYKHVVLFTLGDQGNGLDRYKAHSIETTFCLARMNHTRFVPSDRLNRWIRGRLVFLFKYRLAALMARHNISLVHSHVAAYLDAQADAASIHNVPWVFSSRELYGLRNLPERYPQKIACHLARRTNTRLVGVSQAALASWTDRARFPADQCVVIPNGVDTTLFRRRDSVVPNWRARLNIPHDAVVFGSTGRLAPEKGFDTFVDAASNLIGQSETPAYFAIAGSGNLSNELKSRTVERKLQDRFHFLGFQADIAGFLQNIDVFVLPSRSEGLSMSLLEACATGLPCIATSVGGSIEVLADNNGILISPDAPLELTNAMKLMLDPSTRAKFGRSAFEVAQKYSISRTAHLHQEMYTQLLAQPG